ncbi:MAG TPA: protein kinase [Thermoanaerobaculia bacterium]|nr:protein kinase [Thermoanaerobaculia bacterium]
MTTETRRPSLLVVDDDDTREALAELLRDEGFAVATAKDGAQAVERLQDHLPDLVLLDIVMPRTTGLELLGSLRQRHSPAELPVIMMSAKGQSADVVAALSQGANDYVTKPLDLPIVLARVRAQLRTKEASARADRPEASAADRIGPGVLLDGRFLLEERLGTGSFGVVFRARDEQRQMPVAVKVLKSALADSQEALERLRRESRAARELNHPHAVEVHELRVTPEGVAFLVMEYLEGRGLDEELRERRLLTPQRAAAVVLPVCEVLAAAHAQGMVHRDIKPANVFLQRTPEGERVKVLDFGLAKPMGAAALERNLTLAGSILGSPAYMAPERLRNQPYDGRADVYSLGVMLYEMLTGRLPFVSADGDPLAVVTMHLTEEPRPPRALRPDLPELVDAVVMQALVKDPAERPQASVLGRRLAAALELDVPVGLLPDYLSTLRFGVV